MWMTPSSDRADQEHHVPTPNGDGVGAEAHVSTAPTEHPTPDAPLAGDNPDGSNARTLEPGPNSADTLIAWTFWCDARFNTDPTTIPFYKENLPPLRRAFEAEFGKITTEYFCANIVGGYLITDHDRLYIVNNETGEDAAEVAELIEDAGRLENDVHDCLQGDAVATERQRCVQLVALPVSTALGILDDTAGIADKDQKARARSRETKSYALSKGQLDYARSYFERVAQRTAQLRYFRGVVDGAGGMTLLGIILAALILWALPALGVSTGGLVPLAASLVAGAAGAVVSVMSRMSFGQLKLDATVGEKQLVRLGAFRPLIGSIFGVAIAALIAGGILPISHPATAAPVAYFFAGVGFLAGFSERWAQDMLSETKNLIGKSKTGDQPDASSTPKPALGST
jgi:hypothetical protein